MFEVFGESLCESDAVLSYNVFKINAKFINELTSTLNYSFKYVFDVGIGISQTFGESRGEFCYIWNYSFFEMQADFDEF